MGPGNVGLLFEKVVDTTLTGIAICSAVGIVGLPASKGIIWCGKKVEGMVHTHPEKSWKRTALKMAVVALVVVGVLAGIAASVAAGIGTAGVGFLLGAVVGGAIVESAALPLGLTLGIGAGLLTLNSSLNKVFDNFLDFCRFKRNEELKEHTRNIDGKSRSGESPMPLT